MQSIWTWVVAALAALAVINPELVDHIAAAIQSLFP